MDVHASAEARCIHQRRLWASAIALTTLCIQYSVSLTGMSGATRSDRAEWNDAEIHGLLDYLEQHKSAMGEAGNFKPSVYSGAADSIARYLTTGPGKTGKMVKTKWQSVSPDLFSSSLLIEFYVLLAQIYVQCYTELSANIRMSLGQ